MHKAGIMARQQDYNFDVISGDTFEGFDVTIEVNEEALNLAGCDILVQFKTSPFGAPVLEKSVGNGITITDEAAGKWQFDACEILLGEGSYYYDARILFTDGRVKTYQKGTMTVFRSWSDYQAYLAGKQ